MIKDPYQKETIDSSTFDSNTFDKYSFDGWDTTQPRLYILIHIL